jgi:hypothetical protein
MIARLWTGRVPLDKAADYLQLMTEVAIPDYRAIPGNLGAWCLSREDGGTMTVSMLTFWSDFDAIRRFAGTPIDKAKYYDFDAQFLLEMPERVQHFDVRES